MHLLASKIKSFIEQSCLARSQGTAINEAILACLLQVTVTSNQLLGGYIGDS
jgi:hypothetical protein